MRLILISSPQLLFYKVNQKKKTIRRRIQLQLINGLMFTLQLFKFDLKHNFALPKGRYSLIGLKKDLKKTRWSNLYPSFLRH